MCSWFQLGEVDDTLGKSGRILKGMARRYETGPGGVNAEAR